MVLWVIQLASLQKSSKVDATDEPSASSVPFFQDLASLKLENGGVFHSCVAFLKTFLVNLPDKGSER